MMAAYRNSIIRDRALPAANYLYFMQAYDTFYHLAEKQKVYATMYDNSKPAEKTSEKIVIYKDGKATHINNKSIRKLTLKQGINI
ncbi:hypothetical protein PN36_03315 [Candidatus Thiomargarita nelsonii]|uniref:Uncharacterized protein n=1 Tax=Candidatus Thiomargarita nelsonii TaxID=1003181 RepID=A0A0A6PBQ3_9GAMM|nr:hypothetical protein PN36_03315 [Candidatus Thiomargarita nelsonii]